MYALHALMVNQALTASSPSTRLYLPVQLQHLPSFWQYLCAADTLSCIEVAALAGFPCIIPQNLAITQEQEDDASVTGHASLDLEHVSILATNVTLLCDVTTGTL